MCDGNCFNIVFKSVDRKPFAEPPQCVCNDGISGHHPGLDDDTSKCEIKHRRNTRSKRSAAIQGSPAPDGLLLPPFSDDQPKKNLNIYVFRTGGIYLRTELEKASASDRGRPRLQHFLWCWAASS